MYCKQKKTGMGHSTIDYTCFIILELTLSILYHSPHRKRLHFKNWVANHLKLPTLLVIPFDPCAMFATLNLSLPTVLQIPFPSKKTYHRVKMDRSEERRVGKESR